MVNIGTQAQLQSLQAAVGCRAVRDRKRGYLQDTDQCWDRELKFGAPKLAGQLQALSHAFQNEYNRNN